MSDTNTNKQFSDDPRKIISTKKSRDLITENAKHFRSSAEFTRLDVEEKGDILVRSLVNYFWVPQWWKGDVNKANEWLPYAEGILDLIKFDYCNDFTKLKSYSIDTHWVLELTYTDGRKDHITLLTDTLIMSREATARKMFQEQGRISREAIRQKYLTESYLWWDVLVVYEALWDVTKQVATEYGTTATMGAYAGRVIIPNIYHRVRLASITYRSWNGERKSLTVDRSPETTWPKDVVSQQVVSQLSLKGIVPDVLKWGFAPRAIASMHKAQFDIIQMSFENFQTAQWEDGKKYTRTEFETTRQALLSEIEKLDKEISTGRKTTDEIMKAIQKWFIEVWKSLKSLETKDIKQFVANNKLKLAGASVLMPLHVMMLGVFATKFHENAQDSMTKYATWGEWAAFELWSRIGGRIWQLFLAWKWKAFTGLAFGMWWVQRAEKIAHAVYLDRKAWIAYPEREDEDEKMGEWEGKSFIDHSIALWTVNDILDDPNIPYTDKKKPRGDIRIPGTRGGIDVRWMDIRWTSTLKIPIPLLSDNTIDTWWALPYPARIGKDSYTSIPDVAIWKHNISFGTDPRTYMSSGVSRDMDFWNERISEYQTWILPQIRTILWDFENSRGFFTEANVRAQFQKIGQEWTPYEEQKRAILRERLRSLFGAPLMWILSIFNGDKGLGEGMARANELVDFISEIEWSVANAAERDKRIAWWTIQQTEILKITPSRITSWKWELIKDEWTLKGEWLQFLANFDDTKDRKFTQEGEFFNKIFDRIRKKERLIQTWPYDTEIIKARKENRVIEERQTGVWIETELLGTKSRKYVQFKEAIWFAEFLEDQAPIKNTDFVSMWWSIPTFWDAFYDYLNRMVAFKRQEQFVRNLEKNGMATQWRSSEFPDVKPQKPNGMLKAIKDNPLRF